MCFELDSQPPVAPIAGAAVTHATLTLNSADGTPFMAFAATPDEPATTGVVVLPDVRGLYSFYEELALRFAERGMHAVAIDYFGRTAASAERGEDFPFREHVDQTTPDGIRDDVGAAVAHLREQGAQAIGHGIAGAVGFYGMPGERGGRPGAIQRAGEISAPILALMAGADQAIGADQVAALDAALSEAGVEHEVVTYEGAPHSFFDRKQDEYAEASEDAWRRTLAFIERHA